MARLERAGASVAAAQVALSAIAADATEDDRMPAIQALAEAENEVYDAEAAVRLFADPPDTSAPAPVTAETGVAPVANTNPEARASEAEPEAPEAGEPERDASRLDGGRTPSPLMDREAAITALLAEEVARVAEGVQLALDAGRRDEALAHIAEERQQAQVMARAAAKADEELERLELAVRCSAVGYPLTEIRLRNTTWPVGGPVPMEPELLDQLVASGDVSRTPPEPVAADATDDEA